MRGRGSDGLRSAGYDPQAALGTVGFAKKGLNELQGLDPLGLRFQDRVRAGSKIAQVEARKMNNVAGAGMELEVAKIISSCEGALLSLRLKLGRKGAANTAAIGEDGRGRRPRILAIP